VSLTIYGIVASRAIRPLWAAQELGLDFEHVQTDYKLGESRHPDFLAVNPNGHIPALVDRRPEGQVVVWESMACTLYLARVHGKPDGQGLSPSNPREEAEALRWSFWTVNEVEKDALTVLMHRQAMPVESRKPDQAEAAEKRLRVPLQVLEDHLRSQQSRGQNYLAADRFTVADLCVASVLMWVRVGAREMLADFPLAAKWLDDCLQRPAYVSLRRPR